MRTPIPKSIAHVHSKGSLQNVSGHGHTRGKLGVWNATLHPDPRHSLHHTRLAPTDLVTSWTQPIENVVPCPGHWSGNARELMTTRTCPSMDWDRLALAVRRVLPLPHDQPLPCNETACLYVPENEAKRVARSTGIAFGFLVRDGMHFLERNLLFVMQLGSLFARHWVLFVENDSVDGTKALLADYQRRHSQVQGDMLNGVARNTSVALCPQSSRNCQVRIALLAQLRQRVYDRALALQGWDVFVMLDIDFLAFSQPDFLQMHYLGRRLNASGVVGQSMYRNSRNHCAAYDLSALVPSTALNLIKANCFGVIQSGHGGVSLLYADAVRAASPTPAYTWISGQQMPPANEHITLNVALSAWGAANGRPFLVDPRFRAVYNFGEYFIVPSKVAAAERAKLARLRQNSSSSRSIISHQHRWHANET